MGNIEFMDLCIKTVVDYVNEHLDITDHSQISCSDVYVVWLCKTLQNNKALLSTRLLDGMYYELTYNGDTDQLYLDAYKKFENRSIQLVTLG